MFEQMIASATSASQYASFLFIFMMLAVMFFGVLLAKTDFPSRF
ncbi:MAG: hypothetical protein QHH12_04645 [Candidatus Bathyarchaeota archaeon]|jgi:hypothetical protein|nr:hypothetical protein [Candidatus Bathyarchaeota archaeon]